MAIKSGFPYFELEFDRTARRLAPTSIAAVSQELRQAGTTDVVVMSHGWNNDMAEARELYARWLASARSVLDGGAIELGARKIGFVGVLWPSKRFAERALVPGGAAGLTDSLDGELSVLEEALDRPEEQARITTLRALEPRLENDPAARRDFVLTLRALLGPSVEDDDEDGTEIFTEEPAEVFVRARESLATGPSDEGGAAGVLPAIVGSDLEGGAAGGLGDFLRGAKDAARALLNLTTYYTMKARAGVVGSAGLHPALDELIAGAPGIRVHLVGHSFGGRLVTAAAHAAGPGARWTPATMTLLQAAFSHHGFSPDKGDGKAGFFRQVVGRVTGPTLITHTANDKPVGIAYAIASRLSGDDAAGLGGPDDRFGGLGRNGAQKTPEARSEHLLDVGAQYALSPATIHNLEASAFVSGHSDVSGRQVAYATLCAIGSS